MRILVTGGAGFIGSNFVHYWLAHHPQDEITVLDLLTYAGNLDNLRDLQSNRRLTFVKGDIRDYQLDRELVGQADIVLHLAAETHVDRSLLGPEAERQFWETNVEGTNTLLKAVVSHGGASKRRTQKFIHMSTDEVWGELPFDETKFDLETPLDPRQPYSASKAEAQITAHSWNHFIDGYDTLQEDAISAVVNCTNVVGEYQFPEKFIPLSVTNVLEGKPIRVYGDGINVREWIYIGDLCRGFEAVIENGRVGGSFGPYKIIKDGREQAIPVWQGHRYLFGSGEETTNMELAKTILRMMDKPIEIAKPGEDTEGKATIHLVGDRPIHDLRYAIDYSQTTRELGWKPEYKLEQSLQRTIDWYKRNPQWWRPLKEGKRVVFEWGGNTVSQEGSMAGYGKEARV
ncbi:MAG: dTDP-glucose 4,6-dehydratase [bacterium]|nr:dTDP-glucose 4,6-dehydratase [bacterium]